MDDPLREEVAGPAEAASRTSPGPDPRLACVPSLQARHAANGTVHVVEDSVPAATRRGRLSPGAARGVAHADVALLCGARSWSDLDEALFLDTETTGLGGGAGTFVFLLGVAWFEGERLRTRQWVLPDPADEGALLDALDEEAGRSRALVTFHGGGFDLPRLEERCLLAGRPFPFARHRHVDLLTGARRVFKLRTRHVALQHLERDVLGLTRLDDLPGAECPAAWYDYLRGNGAPMARVLEHNLLDLLSLPALYAALAEVASGAGVPCDLHGAGRAFARGGATERALGLQRRALDEPPAPESPDVTARAHAEIAALLRRLGDAEGSAKAALAAARADPSLAEPWLVLAKHAEHRRRDLDLALDCARRLESLLVARGATPRRRAEVAHRVARLERKRAAVEDRRAPGARAPDASA